MRGTDYSNSNSPWINVNNKGSGRNLVDQSSKIRKHTSSKEITEKTLQYQAAEAAQLNLQKQRVTEIME